MKKPATHSTSPASPVSPAMSTRLALTIALALLLGVATAPSLTADDSGRVEIDLSGVRNTKGQILAAIYNSEKSWLDPHKSLRKQKFAPKGATLQLAFGQLPPGNYAISIAHDENNNGKLDMRWFPFPKPKEGAALSRNPKPRMGPPTWEDSVFTVSPAETKKLPMRMMYR